MVLDDIKFQTIIEGYMDDLLNYADMMAIGGGGPPDSQDITWQKQDIRSLV